MLKEKEHKCSSSPDKFSTLCTAAMKADGARITTPRLEVIKLLGQSLKPLSPQEILDKLKKISIAIDLASIYRILKYLESLKLIHQIGQNGAYFPCLHSNCSNLLHLVIRCSKCDSVKELHLPKSIQQPLEKFIEEKLSKDFSKVLTIEGDCGNC